MLAEGTVQWPVHIFTEDPQLHQHHDINKVVNVIYRNLNRQKQYLLTNSYLRFMLYKMPVGYVAQEEKKTKLAHS